jgi:hypothetical protein
MPCILLKDLYVLNWFTYFIPASGDGIIQNVQFGIIRIVEGGFQ